MHVPHGAHVRTGAPPEPGMLVLFWQHSSCTKVSDLYIRREQFLCSRGYVAAPVPVRPTRCNRIEHAALPGSSPCLSSQGLDAEFTTLQVAHASVATESHGLPQECSAGWQGSLDACAGWAAISNLLILDALEIAVPRASPSIDVPAFTPPGMLCGMH